MKINLTTKTDKNNFENIIKPVIKDIFNEKITGVNRFETGLCHYVYDILLDSGRNIVFRISSLENKNLIEGSVYWYNNFIELGIEIPKLLYSDTTCEKYELPFTISERLKGDDIGNVVNNISDENLNNIAKKVANIQNKISTLKIGKGFGEATSYESNDLKDKWIDFIYEKINRIEKNIIKINIFDISYVDKVKELIDNNLDYFDNIEPIPFFDDITSKNIIINNGKFSGVVDFDSITFGDKLFWLGLCNMAFISLDKEIYIDYLIKHLNCSQKDKKIINIYTLVFCIDFMSGIGQKYNKDEVVIDENLVKKFKEIYDELLCKIKNNFTFQIVQFKDEIDILKNQESIYNDFSYKYDIETINFLKDNLDRKNSLYLIVKENDNFVAFISTDTKWWEDNCFFIREIFISPYFQKNGLGKILMQKCINHAIKNNAKAVVIQTAFDNIPMQKLCKKLNFKKWNNPEWKEGITYKLKL